MAGDGQVKTVQTWLNATYGARAGWEKVAEDGITGWATMYAIRRALQVELGISPLSSGFGPTTSAAFTAQVGRIDGRTTSASLLQILSAALWCKGYWGLFQGQSPTFAKMTGIDSLAGVRQDLGLNPADLFVDLKLMVSLTTMDAYTKVSAGSDGVREIQQWFNATYLGRADFGIVPCDGVYSRQVQTALLYGLQYELGMADGVANGNFGPGTRSGIQSRAMVGPGSVDGASRFVRLFQATMRFNSIADVPFSGSFDSLTMSRTQTFQSFMELPATGKGDYSTWCALLVSSGDTTVATKGFDTNVQLTAVEAKGAVAQGYTAVGRYTVGAGKFITAPELEGLRDAGLKLFPIHQRLNNSADVMTKANGRLHGIEAIERCRTLGLPSDSIVYFCVDFDADGEAIAGPVVDYFQGVKEAMDTALSITYKVGVYGTRNACTQVIGKGYAESAFVAGMSTGFSGNMGFAMPGQWQYNQVVEVLTTFPGASRSYKIDHDVVSSQATPVKLTSVVAPPVERDGSASATGFDAFFEWVVRAEVACERGLKEFDSLQTPLKRYQVFTPSFIAHWLQKPKYWTALWKAYTPVLDAGTYDGLARNAAEDALGRLVPPKPVTTRDFEHFAATFRGYQVWDVPTTPADYGLGDLGGWGLDLLSLWGAYLAKKATQPTLDLKTFCEAQIGAVSSTAGFDRADVVADADAYLVAASVKQNNTNLSGALRVLLRKTAGERIRLFYSQRFAASSADAVSCFARMCDGLEVGSIHLPDGVSRAILLGAANASRVPTQAEATICATSYARMMASAT